MKKSFYLQSLLVFCLILCAATANATVPVITTNPANNTVCQNDTAKFVLAANDTPGALAITYSWLVSSDGGTTWTLVKDTLFYSGSATDTLSVAGDSTINNQLYKAIATNTDGADTSSAATLTVRQLPVVGPIIGAASVCNGSTLTLSDTTGGGKWTSTTLSIATIGSSSGIVSGISQGYDSIKYAVTNSCGTTTVSRLLHVDTVVVALPITGPTTTCVGHVITLSNVNVLGTGVWSTGNTNASVSGSGIVTGLHGGNDVISYMFTNACNSVSSSLSVEVDTTLAHGTISGASNVCAGSWIHLSETVGGGMWISGSTPIAVIDGSGNVTGVSGGVDVISYYLSNGCGASIATATVTVDRPASVITGGDSVGIGATLALHDTAAGGTWSLPIVDTSIAIIDPATGVVTGRDTGIIMVTYSVTNTCGTSSAMMTLYVSGAPYPGQIYGDAGFDSTVCMGSTMNLYDTAHGGFGTWSLVNDTVATISSTGVVTGVKPGLDTALFTFTNAFGTSISVMPIVVNQPPVVTVTGPAIVSLGGDYFLSGMPQNTWNPPSPQEYGTWSLSNNHMGEILSVIDSSGLGLVSNCSFVVLNSGTDTITYKIHNECGTSSKYWVVTLAGGGVGVTNVSGEASAFHVYPNPTDGAFTINVTSGVTEQITVAITNVVGEKVSEMTISTNKEYNIRLDQPAGTYFLSANTSTGRFSSKITIAK
jgi:type IX secretion system substrate protein